MNPIETQAPYDAGDGTEITLEVTFGNGHRGRAAVRLDGREVARGSDRLTARLGPAAGLRGSTVTVTGTINRTGPTPVCTVDYELRGGPAPGRFGGEANFDTDGEPVDVDAVFTLR